MDKSPVRSINEKKSETITDLDKARMNVFSCFIDSLLALVESSGQSLTLSFNIRVMDRLTHIPLNGAYRGEIRARLFGKKVRLSEMRLVETQMRSVFQIIYEELCILIGPVKTDDYCRLALSSTKQLPEAALYSPQNLL